MKLGIILCLVFMCVLSDDYPIKNIVVLMQENRSFDHLLGWLKAEIPEIDGLNGDEYNLENCTNVNSTKIVVDKLSHYISPFDPSHGLESTTTAIFCHEKEANMGGFVYKDLRNHEKVKQVPMSMFPPEKVSVITSLVREFAVFDQWHASLPGPTYPNRMFAAASTSDGATANNPPPEGYPVDIIFDSLREYNRTWRMYFHDVPYELLVLGKLRETQNLANMQMFSEFFLDARGGRLPSYSFLCPKYSPDPKSPASDQHPDHSVAVGERLIKDVYEALRASPQWNHTLFIITYDEHGGFYDHVIPPFKGIPNPDGKNSTNPPFAFDRLGVRVPMVMVSPWINKGVIVHEPNGPTETSHFEHSSIPSTVKKIFGIPGHFSKREEWAGTFEQILLDRKEPRTDCPEKLPFSESYTSADLLAELSMPINDLQAGLSDAITTMTGYQFDSAKTQGEWGQIAREAITNYLQKHISFNGVGPLLALSN